MEGIAVEYFPSLIDPGNNKEKSWLPLYISDNNEDYVCYSHAHIFNILKTFLESVILVSCVSTVWEDTYGCVKQYRCYLDIYLKIVL